MGPATKRLAAKAEAAELIDIAALLAPFFPPSSEDVFDLSDASAEHNIA